ncbi:Mu transposase C-terminal domain-containing protein [Nonomuraea sp. NPDC048916]|uniref:Mu transposase C-terminal domain-containing protein n=1 Tax=Nonomuraea sp. NPDC048916 TaxID=3154232 RepID=UPI00340CA0E5
MKADDDNSWPATLARLRDLQKTKALTTGHVRMAAEAQDVSTRTIYRRLREDAPTPPGKRGRPRYELTDIDRDAFAYYRSVAALHRAREAARAGRSHVGGVPTPAEFLAAWADAPPLALRTLQNAFAEQTTSGWRAALTTGDAGERRHRGYLQRPEARRNQVWEMDHKNLPIVVLLPRGRSTTPWVTTIIDTGTRVLLGWAVALKPSSATVLTALRMALVYEPERSPFGAVPALVRYDRGLEFAAHAVQDALRALCVETTRLPAFQPQLKGKIERHNRTIDQMFLSALPGYTEGPRKASGRLYGPIADDARSRANAGDQPTPPMRIETFVERFAQWVTWYNTEHHHSSLHGLTPLQAWENDDSALHRVPTETLRYLLLAGKERIVQTAGVRHNNLYYQAPELNGRGGERVAIRYMPHEDRWIDVYQNGEYRCTATAQRHMSEEQREQHRAEARKQDAELRRQRHRAARITRTVLAPMTGSEPAEETRLYPTAADANFVPTLRNKQKTMTALSRSDLLGLRPPAARRPSEGNE